MGLQGLTLCMLGKFVGFLSSDFSSKSTFLKKKFRIPSE